MTNETKLYAFIGNKIRIKRRQLELTQDQLAHFVGLCRPSIALIELGKQRLPLHTLYPIARLLGIEAKELLPEIKDVSNFLSVKEMEKLRRQPVRKQTKSEKVLAFKRKNKRILRIKEKIKALEEKLEKE